MAVARMARHLPAMLLRIPPIDEERAAWDSVCVAP
jgi:hypothetical protein